MSGDDCARGPELVVADRVAHWRAEAAIADGFVQITNDRVEPRLEAHLHRHVRGRDRIDDLDDGFEARCEWFLGEDRFARVERRQDQVTMKAGRRDDDDRVHAGVGDELTTVGVAAFDPPRDLRYSLDAVGVGVGRGGDRGHAVLGQEVQRHRVGAGDAAAADDPEAQRPVDRAHVRWASSTQLPSGSSTIATF